VNVAIHGDQLKTEGFHFMAVNIEAATSVMANAASLDMSIAFGAAPSVPWSRSAVMSAIRLTAPTSWA
jgi:hypothetical protein